MENGMLRMKSRELGGGVGGGGECIWRGGVERAEVGAEQKGGWGNKGELEMVLNVGARLEKGTESQKLG